jgi:GTPase SAR1 family protein
LILVYDITDRLSFSGIATWTRFAGENAPAGAKMVLVGNKADLDERRQICQDEGMDAAYEIGATYFTETSALTDQGIKDLLSVIAALVPSFENEEAPLHESAKEKKTQCNC